MPTTKTTPIDRKHRERQPNWSTEPGSPRVVTFHQGRPGAAPASRRVGRSPAIGPVSDEMRLPPAASEVPSREVPKQEAQSVSARQVHRNASDFWSQFSAAQPLLAFSFLWGVVCTVVFGLDLCTGWLFWRASVLMDVSFMLCGLGLIFLCWDTYRDFR